ncbi:MAG: aminotransferase class V-fold PLP-dependent enzyme [Clostridia bacterium]|nr:aminotransferase class V-fold PLP-dependent enzyme [Clostridia bacterium]
MIKYFDNASTTFRKPRVVYKALRDYKKYGANLSRGNNQSKCKQIVESTRENIKKLVGVGDNYDVAFSQSATYSTNQILKGLDYSKIKTIYISNFEHNAVLRVVNSIKQQYSTEVITLETKGFQFDIDAIKKQFKDKKPDLIIVCHVSNVCGLIQDYKVVFDEGKKYGATTILDMAQSCGMIKINLQRDKVDVAIFAGHKTLYGLAGIGGAIIRKGLKINDYIQGGTGVDSANEVMPKEMPTKLEPGTQNILGIFSLYHSTQYLLKIGFEFIERRERRNYMKLKSILLKSKVLKIIEIENATTIVSCVPLKHQPDNYEQYFNKKGIAVRIGLQCSPIAHKTLGTYPAGTIRFSVSLFTKQSEFDALNKAILQLNELMK